MPSRLLNTSIRNAGAAVLLLSALGCIDPDARYDDFIERSQGMRGQDAGGVESSERFDFSGTYLLALATTLAPGQPLLFSCEISVAADLETFDFAIQPLTTDDTDTPRALTGERLDLSGIAYEEDGSFAVDFGEVTVPGDANPISGSEIVASVAIDAAAFPMTDELPNYFCGATTGMVSVPVSAELAGSTIGAVEVESTNVTEAEPLVRCPD